MTIRIDGTNTAANPGITGTDTDTGLQFGTDEISIVTGGEEQVKVDSGGRVLLEKAVRFQYNTDSTDSRTWMMSPDVHGHGNFSVRVSDAQTSTNFDTKFTFKGTGGLCFNGDTSDANALSDYEEGTWTPVWQCSSGSFTSVTHTIQTGNYTKIGNLVHVACRLRSTASSGGAGVLLIGGLPFQVNCATGSGGGAPSFFQIDVAGGTVTVATETRNGTNQFYLLASTDAGSWANVGYDGIFGNDMSELRVAFAYQTNS